ELLHPSFSEVGASGRRFDREEILAHLAPLQGVDAEEFVADEIAPGVVLLRYVTTGSAGSAERTSVWVKEGGRWLLRHHQGTPQGSCCASTDQLSSRSRARRFGALVVVLLGRRAGPWGDQRGSGRGVDGSVRAGADLGIWWGRWIGVRFLGRARSPRREGI